jgi:predicted NUDIX family NTP pyrophosphohydrolase
MRQISAGLLMFRRTPSGLEFLLVHPGGPFFKNKDEGAWTIPKGQACAGEDLLACAQREFEEETGSEAAGNFIPLTAIQQRGGKVVHAWAFEGDCDPAALVSNTFKIEWPPRSGKQAEFPEIDRAEFFTLENAKRKINPAQIPLLDEIANQLRGKG